MTHETRFYKVGGLIFSVALDAPWSFMNYSGIVQERIDMSALGIPVPIFPVRDGDKNPPRTFVQSKDELPASFDSHTLDFSQYEPFRVCENEDTLFNLTIQNREPNTVSDIKKQEDIHSVIHMTSSLPYCRVYKGATITLFLFENSEGHLESSLIVCPDKREGAFRASKELGSYQVMMQISFALRIMYTCFSWKHQALIVHSSVIVHDDKANLFIGPSGTGKSTHSRNWLNYINGSELLNDDNPIIRMTGLNVIAYGTPWSGKTPCYRNKSYDVRAVVRLNQDKKNNIRNLSGTDILFNMIPAISVVRWDKSAMDGIMSIISGIAENIPFYYMGCLPDRAAVEMCYNEIEKK